MGYFQDDFESYPLGPFSSADWTAVFFQPTIVTPGNFGSKALKLNFNGIHRFDEADFLDEFTTFFAMFCDHDSGFSSNAFLQYGNRDPNPHAIGTTQLFELFLGSDGTISAVCGSLFAANTQVPFTRDEWHFIQLNLKFRAIGFPSKIAVDYQLVIDSNLLLDGSQGTNVLVGSLFSGSPAINRTQWNPSTTFGYYDDMWVNARRAVNDYPFPGSPHSRVSQLSLEPVEARTGSEPRVSQAVVEWNRLPISSNARISQMVIELPRGKRSVGGWKVKEA